MQKQGDYWNWLMGGKKEWTEDRVFFTICQLYLDTHNRMQSAGSNIEVIRIEDEPFEMDFRTAQPIKSDKVFNEILERTIQNTTRDLIKPKMQNQNDESSYKMQNLTSSNSRILQQSMIKHEQKSNMFRLEKDILSLQIILKGESLSDLKLQAIDIRVRCPKCSLLCESKKVGRKEDLYFFESKCLECPFDTTFTLKKMIQKLQPTWQIGQLKFSKNAEIIIKKISILPVCNCQATPQASKLSMIDITTDEKLQKAMGQFKCNKNEQQRYFCHGCCKELIIVPEWIILK